MYLQEPRDSYLSYHIHFSKNSPFNLTVATIIVIYQTIIITLFFSLISFTSNIFNFHFPSLNFVRVMLLDSDSDDKFIIVALAAMQEQERLNNKRR